MDFSKEQLMAILGVSEDEFHLAVRNVLLSVDGRLFVWALLAHTGYFHAQLEDSETLLFQQGKRSVGQILYHFLEQYQEDFLTTTRKEHRDRIHLRDSNQGEKDGRAKSTSKRTSERYSESAGDRYTGDDGEPSALREWAKRSRELYEGGERGNRRIYDPGPEYELKLDKESILTEDHLKDISEYAKEHKLSEKQAKSLLEMRGDAVGRTHEGLKELHKAKVETWSKELGARKEFAEEKQWVDKAVNHFGTDDLYKTLKDTGYSNYPPLWDFLKGVGRALSNDSLVEGSPAGNDTGPKDLGDIMYPNMK